MTIEKRQMGNVESAVLDSALEFNLQINHARGIK